MPMDPGFEGKARLYSTYSPRTTDTKFLKQKSSNYLFDNYTSINISNRLAFELPEKRVCSSALRLKRRSLLG
jgi:hypothetical protein